MHMHVYKCRILMVHTANTVCFAVIFLHHGNTFCWQNKAPFFFNFRNLGVCVCAPEHAQISACVCVCVYSLSECVSPTNTQVVFASSSVL